MTRQSGETRVLQTQAGRPVLQLNERPAKRLTELTSGQHDRNVHCQTFANRHAFSFSVETVDLREQQIGASNNNKAGLSLPCGERKAKPLYARSRDLKALLHFMSGTNVCSRSDERRAGGPRRLAGLLLQVFAQDASSQLEVEVHYHHVLELEQSRSADTRQSARYG